MSSDGRDLSERIKWLMILRVVVVTFMLGFTVLLQLREGTEFFSTPMRSLYLFIGFFYFLTIAYSIAFHLGAGGSHFAFLQVGVDLVLISGIVLVTGGTESLFSMAYFLVIIGASTLFYRRGGLTAATASALLYAAAVRAPLSPSVAALVGLEQSYLNVSAAYVGYRVVLNVFGFFLVAALSSSLAESLRRAGEELSVKSSHLAELETRNENILQSVSSGLITTDLEGKINYINRTAGRIAGIEAEHALGEHILKVFQLKDDWSPYDNLQHIEGLPLRVEGWVRDGAEEQFLGLTFSLLRNERDQVSGVICPFQDLTRIRDMEEQIRRSDRLAVVGELAAGMAHEIRNPLASLSGSIQLLSEELVLEDTNRELMEIINREVSRLNALITDFLHFASPRPLQLKVVDLVEALQETVTLLEQSSGPEYRFTLIEPGGGSCLAQVDPMLMKQVFWNFSRNAIEAMPEGGDLTMTIERVPVEAEEEDVADNLSISFADTGVGIAPHEVEKVFTPFHSTKEHGTGLGLAIVFKIVEAHRGRIEVESHVGRGTTFRIRFPVRQGVTSLAPLSMGEVT
jgi:two-component system sensor histidine kinase PilS (NtrC family)